MPTQNVIPLHGTFSFRVPCMMLDVHVHVGQLLDLVAGFDGAEEKSSTEFD